MNIVYPDKYYSKIKEKFPELSEEQIKKIITYGVRSLYMMNAKGADIKVQQGRFFAYFGEIISNSDLYMRYRKLKKTVKLRLLQMRNKVPYNGKCYFVLPVSQYEQLKNKKKGSELPFKTVTIFRLQKEAELELGSYLYECDYPEEGIKFKKRLYDNPKLNYQLIGKRDLTNYFGPFIPTATKDKKEKTIKRSPKRRN